MKETLRDFEDEHAEMGRSRQNLVGGHSALHTYFYQAADDL